MTLQRIDLFRGEYRWLSNFWIAEVEFEGQQYPSTEHAFQAAKTRDRAKRALIATLPRCGDAKRAGRALDLRVDWEGIKDDVMYRVCLDKFTRHPDLRAKLLATGDAQLVEGNDHGDRYWGVCHGVGKNMLGITLMRIRAELLPSALYGG